MRTVVFALALVAVALIAHQPPDTSLAARAWIDGWLQNASWYRPTVLQKVEGGVQPRSVEEIHAEFAAFGRWFWLHTGTELCSWLVEFPVSSDCSFDTQGRIVGEPGGVYREGRCGIALHPRDVRSAAALLTDGCFTHYFVVSIPVIRSGSEERLLRRFPDLVGAGLVRAVGEKKREE